MHIYTTRFGRIEVGAGDIIRFPKGILGFEGVERYVLLPHEDGSPFRFLQAVDDPDLAFVVTNPVWFCPDYTVEALQEDMARIGLNEPKDALILSIVTLPRQGGAVTANLLAPIVINSANGLAKQVIQTESKYRTRHDIKEEMRRAREIVQDANQTASSLAASLRTVG